MEIPALRDVVDLAFDRHEQGLLGIGAVVLLELLVGDLPDLDRRRQRRNLLEGSGPLVVAVGGRSEQPRNDVVYGQNESEDSEEGRRRKAGVGHDGLLEGLP